MKRFTIEELCRSRTARDRRIDNTPPDDVRKRLTALADNLLDPLRERWGSSLTVNSGYRCPALNKAVNGAWNSQHLKGEAADITTGSPTENKRLFRMIAESGLEFDQLIGEKRFSWVHVSYKSWGNRCQILNL